MKTAEPFRATVVLLYCTSFQHWRLSQAGPAEEESGIASDLLERLKRSLSLSDLTTVKAQRDTIT
ncbi:MAG: hypothetical protein WA783_15230 [Phormidesmis sp.]